MKPEPQNTASEIGESSVSVSGLESPEATPKGPPQPEPPPDDRPKVKSEVVSGSGEFVRPSGGGPQQLGATGPSGPNSKGEFTLNFVDADIREVVKVILGDFLKQNFVIDQDVQGTVTLQTTSPLPRDAVIAALEDVLSVNGASLVKDGSLYKIVPTDRALRGGVAPRSTLRPRAGVPGSQVVVVPLRHIAASEMQTILEPLAREGAILRVDRDRNVIVLGGSPSELANLLDTVSTFDVDWLAGMSFGVFPLELADAEKMATTMTQLFGAEEKGPLADLVRFIPVTEINSILVISPRASYIERAQAWIQRLDVGQEQVPRVFVYYAQNSRAADLAAVLSEIFSPGSTQGVGRSSLAPGLRPVSTTTGGFNNTQRSGTGTGTSGIGGTSGLSGTSSGLTSSGTSTSGTSIGGTGIGGTSTSGLSDTANPTNRTSSSRQRTGRTSISGIGGALADQNVTPVSESDIRIIPDEVKNAVVVLATPRDYRLVQTALKQLDIMPLQVLIEATILEVTLNDNLEYGVEWFLSKGNVSITNRSLDLAGSNIGNQLLTIPATLSGFSFLYQTNDARVLIHALQDVSTLKVISSPSLFVLDNQTANLQVGQQVPTLSQQSNNTAGDNIVSSIEYRDTGVILAVTPRVNQGGLVTLEIAQEVSNVVTTTTSDLDSPTIQQRRVETTAAVQDGQTIALGGLIQDRRENGSSGLPFLSRIPFIGWLFSTQFDDNNRTELLVLITPRVVGDSKRAREVTQELQRRMRTVVPLVEQAR